MLRLVSRLPALPRRALRATGTTASSRFLASRLPGTQFLRSHFGRPSTTLASPGSLKPEVCPPSLRQAPVAGSAWQRFLFWLMAPAPTASAPAPNRLPTIRTDFLATLADVDCPDTDTLRRRIEDSRSLRELWHLRAEVYRLVGVAHSEWEAEQRLTLLNRHFPTRAPRSQFSTSLQ